MKIVLLTALAVTLSACAKLPVVAVGADPTNPRAAVPRTRYVPVTAGTVDFRPVEPKPWVEQNGNVAPKTEGQ